MTLNGVMAIILCYFITAWSAFDRTVVSNFHRDWANVVSFLVFLENSSISLPAENLFYIPTGFIKILSSDFTRFNSNK